MWDLIYNINTWLANVSEVLQDLWTTEIDLGNFGTLSFANILITGGVAILVAITIKHIL